jgi:hypothetical protein
MTHRKTMGFTADAAESAALTVADPRATERIIEACDYEHDEQQHALEMRRLMKRNEKRRNRAVTRVKEELGDGYADVLNAYLQHRSWRDIGIPKRTFGDRLKKVKIFFEALK